MGSALFMRKFFRFKVGHRMIPLSLNLPHQIILHCFDFQCGVTRLPKEIGEAEKLKNRDLIKIFVL